MPILFDFDLFDGTISPFLWRSETSGKMGSSPTKPFLREIEELQRMVEFRYTSHQVGAAASTNQLLALANARILDDKDLEASITEGNVKARERLSWETGRLAHLETILREATDHKGENPLLPWGTTYEKAVALATALLLRPLTTNNGNHDAPQVMIAKDLLREIGVRVKEHSARDVINSFHGCKLFLCPLFADKVSKRSESDLSFGPCAMEYVPLRGVMIHLAKSSVHQISEEKMTGKTLKVALKNERITAFLCELCPAESRQLFCHCWQVVEHVLAKHCSEDSLKTRQLLGCDHCKEVTTSKYRLLAHHFLSHRDRLDDNAGQLTENPISNITAVASHRAVDSEPFL